MLKAKIISCVSLMVGICMISMGMVMQRENSIDVFNNVNYKEVDIKSMAASYNMIVKSDSEKAISTNTKNNPNLLLEEVRMETAPASIIIPPRVEVYDHLTIEELADKLNRNLGNDYIAGKGMLIASYCIEKGVDPYIAVAIMLHETGCSSRCSNLARSCNNVGGQKGAPGCGGGSYKAFATLDEGIKGFIDNLYRNYYAYGLNTVEAIGPKYAEGSTWVSKINWYVNKIRNS